MKANVILNQKDKYEQNKHINTIIEKKESLQRQPYQKSSTGFQIFGNNLNNRQTELKPANINQQLQNVVPVKNSIRIEKEENRSVISNEKTIFSQKALSQTPLNSKQSILNLESLNRLRKEHPTNIEIERVTQQSQVNSINNVIAKQSTQLGVSREALKDNINKKNQLIKDLTLNRNFFRDSFEKRNSEFKEHIRCELKKNIYDKVLKTSLHYIYKHYENLKNSMNREETLRILNNNLLKQQDEIKDTLKKIVEFESSNKKHEEKIISMVNQVGLIKAQPIVVDNITKEDIDIKINELNRENKEIEQKLSELNRQKEKKMYELKMKHENKGRFMMEQRAVKLALQYSDTNDEEQFILKEKIENLIKRLDSNEALRKNSQNYILKDKKQQLEKELELLKCL
jgi:hypothetical protein